MVCSRNCSKKSILAKQIQDIIHFIKGTLRHQIFSDRSFCLQNSVLNTKCYLIKMQKKLRRREVNTHSIFMRSTFIRSNSYNKRQNQINVFQLILSLLQMRVQNLVFFLCIVVCVKLMMLNTIYSHVQEHYSIENIKSI